MSRSRKPAIPFRYFNSSPEVIRILARMNRLQKLASLHADVHNNFNSVRHLVDRDSSWLTARPHWPNGRTSWREDCWGRAGLRRSETSCE